MSLDYFRHDFAACRLQWPFARARQEPHAFVFVAAVNDMDAVVRHCVVERGARIFGDESEESVPPGILGVRKDLFADLLELFNAGCSNGFRDGFATLFVKALKIEFFKWHKNSPGMTLHHSAAAAVAFLLEFHLLRNRRGGNCPLSSTTSPSRLHPGPKKRMITRRPFCLTHSLSLHSSAGIRRSSFSNFLRLRLGLLSVRSLAIRFSFFQKFAIIVVVSGYVSAVGVADAPAAHSVTTR